VVRSFMRTLFVTSTGLWSGGGLLFSAVVLPTLFLNLDTSDAGRIAALLFPGYYAFGVVLGVAWIVSAGYLSRSGRRACYAALAAAIVATSCHVYAAFEIRPQMTELRGQPEGIAEFQRLHRLSVRLNGVVLVLTVGALLASAKIVEER
jgi:hypothetical protein